MQEYYHRQSSSSHMGTRTNISQTGLIPFLILLKWSRAGAWGWFAKASGILIKQNSPFFFFYLWMIRSSAEKAKHAAVPESFALAGQSLCLHVFYLCRPQLTVVLIQPRWASNSHVLNGFQVCSLVFFFFSLSNARRRIGGCVSVRRSSHMKTRRWRCKCGPLGADLLRGHYHRRAISSMILIASV